MLLMTDPKYGPPDGQSSAPPVAFVVRPALTTCKVEFDKSRNTCSHILERTEERVHIDFVIPTPQ
jgi:hypothetical protein